MPRRRSTRYLVALLIGSLGPLVLAAPRAEAVTFDAGRSILASDCTGWLKWNGGLPTGITPKKWARGTVKLCWVKYRLDDKDKKADYYAITLQSTWRLAGGDRGYPAEMQQTVTSSVASKKKVYGATGSYTSSKSCSSPVTVGFGVGPFSVSTTPQVCKHYGISRYRLNRTEAYWRSTRAGGLRSIETAYVQKVPQGAKPAYNVVFAIPRYRNTWSDGRGYWTSTKRLKWVSWSKR